MKKNKIFKKDMLKWKEYDHVVINDDLNNCYKKIMRVIKTSSEITTDLPFIKNHVKKLLN
jgi:guanylate kinase